MADKQLEALLQENRTFAPSKDFVKNAHANSPKALQAEEPPEVLGGHRRRAALVQEVDEGARLEAAVREVVRRRQDQRRATTASTGTSTTGRAQQGRDPLGGRARRRRATLHLPGAAPRGLHVRQRPQGARRQEGRPRHASTCRWSPRLAIAMLACARIGATAHRHLRRLQRRGARRPHRRRRGQARHHRRRRLSPRQGRPAEGERRRGARRRPDASRRCVVFKRTRRATSPMKHGRDVWWHDVVTDQPAPTARPSRWTASTRSSSSTPRGSTGKPKGVLHTTGGYLRRRYVDDEVGLRPPGRRHLLVHRRRRLGHRPQLRRLRPARATARPSLMYEGAPNFPARTASGRSSSSYKRHASSTPRRRRSAPSCKLGRRVAAEARPLDACACSARSASRSTPRRGCGTTQVIGGERCPIVDTWWQTETGAHHDHAAARRHADQARLRDAAVPRRRRRRRRRARATRRRERGRLPRRSGKPWPACCARIFGDHERYRKHVLDAGARHATSPATAPRATRTATSGSWAASTTCSTSPAIASARWRSRARSSAIPTVAEAAVVGMPDEIKGQAIAAFVTLKRRHEADRRAAEGAQGARRQGDRRPRAARRDPLHRRAAQDPQRQDHAPPAARHRRRPARSGDTTTLEDSNVMNAIKKQYEEKEG